VNDLRGLVVAILAIFLLVLGTANIVGGQLLGGAILLALAGLAAACTLMLMDGHGSDRLDRGRRRYR
jgi:hypothetical protein